MELESDRTQLDRSATAARNLDLLRAATATSPGFAIWKNADAGLAGTGDLDAVAPPTEWANILTAHRRWARSNDLGPALVCQHVPGLLLLAALAPDSPRALLQFDVASHIFVQGAALVPAARLGPLSCLDERGFRVLRPGAQGLFKLLQSADRVGGLPRGDVMDPRVAELLERDPDGVGEAAQLLGPAGAGACRAARAAVDGRWDRRAMVEVAAWSYVAALRRPVVPAKRVAFGLGPAHRCPLIAALEHGRRVPGNVEEWLERVMAAHRSHRKR